MRVGHGMLFTRALNDLYCIPVYGHVAATIHQRSENTLVKFADIDHIDPLMGTWRRDQFEIRTPPKVLILDTRGHQRQLPMALWPGRCSIGLQVAMVRSEIAESLGADPTLPALTLWSHVLSVQFNNSEKQASVTGID